jgi:hypothetical protein
MERHNDWHAHEEDMFYVIHPTVEGPVGGVTKRVAEICWPEACELLYSRSPEIVT